MKSIYKGFTKRTLLAILIVHFSMLSFAATYYVSNLGNDTNTGLTTTLAWKTLAKVNSITFKAGDQILFQKGDTFYGSLIIKNSGTSGNPITFSSYGTGEQPIITGLTTISGWTNEGNGMYSKVISATDVNIVTINGVQYGMGRFPDATYNTYESCSTNTSITDNGLGSATNWTGAELVLRKNAWRLDRCVITGHSGDVITYTDAYNNENAINGYGYFIQKDLRCVTAYGEWYYDLANTKFYMYFGGVDPTTKTVKIATIDYLVTNNGKDYITIDGLSFIGSNKSLLYFNGYYDDYLITQNCTLDLAGLEGIYMEACRYTLTDNNTINRTSTSGIYTQTGTDNTVTNNTIKNVGLVLGLATTGAKSVGLLCHSQAGALIQYNSIDSIAYNGISFPYCKGSSIRNNFINHSLVKLCDGGGIYMNGEGTDGIVDGNIILNIGGNVSGTTLSNSANAGIYLDESATNYTISNNTVAYGNNAGIKLHKAFGNIVSYNISFANDYGIAEQDYLTGTSILTYNQFVAKSSTQYAVKGEVSPAMVVADYNYYARPIDDNLTMMWWVSGYEAKTLAQWKTATNQDAHSQKLPQAITSEIDLQFEYNSFKTAKTVNLSRPMIDVKGTKYSTTVTLQPFTSVVLMKDSTPIVVSDAPTSVIATAGNATASVTFVAPSNNGGSAITGYTVTSIPAGGIDTNAGSISLTHILTGLTNGTSYSFTVKATNSVGTSVASVASNSVTPTAPIASTFTFRGPSSGNVNSISSNFTITPNNPYTGTITLTPTGTGSAGLSTIVLTFSNSAVAQTFTIIPTVAGSITLTPTNNGTLINPASLIYAVNAVVPNAPTSVVATAGNASASVTFVTPTSNGGSIITGYTVTSIPAGGIDTNAGSTSLTHIITGLTNGTSYSFTVKATNSVGTSVASVASNSVIPKAPTATAFTFTGPSSGSINSVSSNFTVTPNNPYTGTITISPTGTGSAGLLSTVLIFSNSSAAQTFTITPIVAGSIILTPTNNGTLINPASLTYNVNAVVPNAPTSVVATSGDTNASVTFIAPTNTGGSAITGYTVTSIPSGGIDTNAGSATLTHIITGLTNGVSYTFTVKATNSVGSSLASDASNAVIPVAASVIIKQGEIVPSHFTTVWQGLNGLNQMNINVVSATLEDIPLSIDDEIAVFSGSACVGASKLTQSIIPSDNTSFVTILASQNDGSGNGFVDNDTIVFKIWNSKAQKELQVNAVVYHNDVSTWKTNGRYSPGATTVAEIASYQVYTQSIELLKGYNMISTYVSAQNPNISVVTKTLVDQGNLIKMQDETGNSLENWGTFGGWINQLGSMEETEGYKIQVANNCTLQVTGRSIAMPFDISLKTGWNIISYPRTDVVNAINVVQTLIDQNKLVKVQDEAGNSIENWGLFGGWKNGIGNFIPGKAYKVKMSADAILTFQESYPKAALVIAKAEQTEYYHSSVEGNGTDHMNIYITGLNNVGLSVGDELAAFDGAVCVATAKVTEANLLSGSASLASSFSTDTQNQNGFKVGDTIQISVWNKRSGDESKVNAEVITGQLKYEKNASVLVKMKSATLATGITNLNDVMKIDVFPNPCQGRITVRFSEIPEANSRIEISDISGRKLVSRLISGTSEEFNLDSFTSGLYLVKSILGSNEFVQKLIVNK